MWKTPTPPGGLQTQKVNLCGLFSCLTVACIWQDITILGRAQECDGVPTSLTGIPVHGQALEGSNYTHTHKGTGSNMPGIFLCFQGVFLCQSTSPDAQIKRFQGYREVRGEFWKVQGKSRNFPEAPGKSDRKSFRNPCP